MKWSSLEICRNSTYLVLQSCFLKFRKEGTQVAMLSQVVLCIGWQISRCFSKCLLKDNSNCSSNHFLYVLGDNFTLTSSHPGILKGLLNYQRHSYGQFNF